MCILTVANPPPMYQECLPADCLPNFCPNS